MIRYHFMKCLATVACGPKWPTAVVVLSTQKDARGPPAGSKLLLFSYF